MTLLYHPLAEQDIEKATDYYRQIMFSLAEDFLDEFASSVERISSQPQWYRKIRGDIRKCNLKRFPYAIYFTYENHQIRILILKHYRQHPALGMDRT